MRHVGLIFKTLPTLQQNTNATNGMQQGRRMAAILNSIKSGFAVLFIGLMMFCQSAFFVTTVGAQTDRRQPRFPVSKKIKTSDNDPTKIRTPSLGQVNDFSKDALNENDDEKDLGKDSKKGKTVAEGSMQISRSNKTNRQVDDVGKQRARQPVPVLAGDFKTKYFAKRPIQLPSQTSGFSINGRK